MVPTTAAVMGKCVKVLLAFAVAVLLLGLVSLYSRQLSGQSASESLSGSAVKLARYHRLDETVGLSLIQREKAPGEAIQAGMRPVNCQSNSCVNSVSNDGISVQYKDHLRGDSELVQATLGPGYKSETLTRLGSDLKFDHSCCPNGSIMTNSTVANYPPLHSDCPTLFIVGARKAGSTSLIQYLSKHPNFEGARLDRGPQAGETSYFHKWFETKTWEEYLEYFPSGDGVMTGESSVGNLVHCLVPKRIHRYCGKQAKIVMLLRNPVDRFVSNFRMRARIGGYGLGKLRQPIAKSIEHELGAYFRATNRKGRTLPKQLAKLKALRLNLETLRCKFLPARNMFYEGIYYIHVMNWLCNFPAENIVIINSEEFFQHTGVILKQVFQFLGLRSLPEESYKVITAAVYNQGNYDNIPPHQRLTEEYRTKLRTAYEPFNKALFELLDWSDVEWT